MLCLVAVAANVEAFFLELYICEADIHTFAVLRQQIRMKITKLVALLVVCPAYMNEIFLFL